MESAYHPVPTSHLAWRLYKSSLKGGHLYFPGFYGKLGRLSYGLGGWMGVPMGSSKSEKSLKGTVARMSTYREGIEINLNVCLEIINIQRNVPPSAKSRRSICRPHSFFFYVE